MNSAALACGSFFLSSRIIVERSEPRRSELYIGRFIPSTRHIHSSSVFLFCFVSICFDLFSISGFLCSSLTHRRRQRVYSPVWDRGTPLPLVHLLPHLFPLFYFSLSFIGLIYFLLLSISSLSTRIVPLRFQAGGRRRRPNLGLVCVVV